MLNYKFGILSVLILKIILSVNEAHGHGMMLEPVSRSSRWRYDKTAPINYDDNALFCGGFGIQWLNNKGRCGLCGDDFAAVRPRDNELGGKYGQGVITRDYSQSQNARLGIKITTNHLGFFYFDICNLDKFQIESEECFSANKVKFSDGSYKMYIGTKSQMIYPTIVLPKNLMCKHCVLRWNYQAGNNWGPCGNGTFAVGCGPQENFKGCSDIRITSKFSRSESNLFRTLFNKIIPKHDYLDFDNFIQRPNQPGDDSYFYKPFIYNDIEADNSFEEEKSVPNFNREIDEYANNEAAEKEKAWSYLKKNPCFKPKHEDEAFDKEVFNEGDYGLLEVPDLVKEDTREDFYSDTLNDLFGFDQEEFGNNELDEGLDDFEYF